MKLRSSARAGGFWSTRRRRAAREGIARPPTSSRPQTRANALVIALLALCANAACSAAESFPTATPESQGLSSQSLAKLLGVVRGFAESGEIVGGELLVIKNRAAPKESRQRLIYFDAESGLTLGYDQVYELPGLGMAGAEVRFSDYREIGGVQIPFKITTKFPTPVLGTLTYQVEKIETGLKLDEDPFKIE